METKEDTIKALIDAPLLHKIEDFARLEDRQLRDVLTEAIVEYLEKHNKY
jgi:hypothetical protein